MRYFLIELLEKEENSENVKKYPLVKTFNTDDSLSITQTFLNTQNKITFSDDMTLYVNNKKIYDRNNVCPSGKCLNKAGFNINYNVSNNLDANKVTNMTLINSVTYIPDKTDKYIFSKPYGKYFLYLENKNTVHLYLNPLQNSKVIKNVYDRKRIYNSIAYKHCKRVQYKDPICPCLPRLESDKNNNLCMSSLYTPTIKNEIKNSFLNRPDEYAQMEKMCPFSNNKCDTTNPFIKALVGKQPNMDITFNTCLVDISASNGNVNNNGGIKINNTCGSKKKTPKSQLPSTPTPTPTATPKSINSNSDKEVVPTFQKNLFVKKNLIILICIVIIIIISILLLY